MNYNICILAAGKGSRTNLSYNKIFYQFKDGKTVLDKSVDLFTSDQDCQKIIIVCASHEKQLIDTKYQDNDKVCVTIGGKTRQESVYNGIQYVDSEYVFIHDGARPYLSKELVDKLKTCLESEDACLLMVPSTDTVKIIKDGYVKETLIRSNVYNAQTPQCFKTNLLIDCHTKARKENKEATDDAQLVEWYSNAKVKVVLSDASNIKITNPGDLPA